LRIAYFGLLDFAPPLWDNYSVRRNIIITIDGTAASGKSTTAREVAKRLGFLYLDTGAMYRAVTLKVVRDGIDPDNVEKLSRMLKSTDIVIDRENRIWLDGEDVTFQIRTPEIDRLVSVISAIPLVRERLVMIQRELGRDGGLVCEGRDIGTVVFPKAELKIYMDAKLSERTKRRKKELGHRGIDVNADDVRQVLSSRDEIDSTRTHSPLRIPGDAVIIDTSRLTIEGQVERVLEEMRKLKS